MRMRPDLDEQLRELIEVLFLLERKVVLARRHG